MAHALEPFVDMVGPDGLACAGPKKHCWCSKNLYTVFPDEPKKNVVSQLENKVQKIICTWHDRERVPWSTKGSNSCAITL